jgi:HK97 family phage major capsid protein
MTYMNDFAAFRRKLAAVGVYEKREAPDMAEIGRTIEKIGSAFDEYKKANDQRLEEIGKKGAADPLLDAKLAKMDAELDALSEVKRRLEAVETRAARPGAGIGKDGERVSKEAQDYRSAFVDWVRRPQDPSVQQKMHAAKAAVEAKAGAGDLERRAAQVVTSTGAAGGFALPEEIERTIARLSVDISPIRQIATVRTVSTTDYKELFDVNGANFEWVGEAGTRSLGTTPDLAEVAPTMGMASARPRASEGGWPHLRRKLWPVVKAQRSLMATARTARPGSWRGRPRC